MSASIWKRLLAAFFGQGRPSARKAELTATERRASASRSGAEPPAAAPEREWWVPSHLSERAGAVLSAYVHVADDGSVGLGEKRLAALVSRLTADDLARLDGVLRSDSYYLPFGRLSGVLLTRMEAWSEHGGEIARLVGLDSMQGSGLARERAVRLLAAAGEPWTLPFLLLRVNDWVFQVRRPAAEAVRRLLEPRSVPVLLDSLELVVRLERSERVDAGELLSSIAALLADHQDSVPLAERLSHPSREVRLWVLRTLEGEAPPRVEEELRSALASSDPVLVREAARALLRVTPRERLAPLLEALVRHFLPAVRAAALRAWAERLPGEAEAPLRAGLVDTTAAVRSEAGQQLRKVFRVDVAGFYRSSVAGLDIDDGSRRTAALLSELSRWGKGDDAELILPFLDGGSAKVRRRALQGVMRLGGRAYLRQALAAVRSSSPKMSRAGREAFLQHRGVADPELVQGWVIGDVPRHARLNALRLLRMQPRWRRLAAYLRLALRPDQDLGEEIRRELGRWLGEASGVHVGPDPDEASELRELLAAKDAAAALGEDRLRRLRFELDRFA